MSQLISCKQLSHNYGSKVALSNIEINLEQGEPIALVGPNGAGKTTLFSILCGYLTPSNGEVKVLGHTPNSPELFGRVGALPQDAMLDPRFSIAKQLVFMGQLQGLSKAEATVESQRVLELVDLSDVLNEKPQALSHGMRKRVSIAQAMIGSPELILLDEPTAGLDPANARSIRKLISDLSDKATFIVSSHNLDELERLCRTVLYLEGGVLKQQQISDEKSEQGFITIQLLDALSEEQLTKLNQLSSILSVEPIQKMEYMIGYDNQIEPYLDQRLLSFLADNNVKYRQIIKGKSLEEQLFSNPEPALVVNG